MRHVPDKYGIIAQYLAMSTHIKKVIYELFTYNEALRSPKSAKWQDIIQEKYNAFVENHIWEAVSVPNNQKVLKGK